MALRVSLDCMHGSMRNVEPLAATGRVVLSEVAPITSDRSLSLILLMNLYTSLKKCTFF